MTSISLRLLGLADAIMLYYGTIRVRNPDGGDEGLNVRAYGTHNKQVGSNSKETIAHNPRKD